MTISLSEKKPKQLASWTLEKQDAYRAQHPDQALVLHLLLDASPSMHAHAQALIRAYALYLAWLQQHASPMSQWEVACFSDTLTRQPLVPLGLAKPLTKAVYDPLQGDGTALYAALGQLCSLNPGPGQHVLVVFTDGLDNRSEDLGWTVGRVHTLLTTLQREAGWLAVFLGAYQDALEEGLSLGFTRGNCLEFTVDKIPEAFQALAKATQKYLTAGPQERKLLTAGGIF